MECSSAAPLAEGWEAKAASAGEFGLVKGKAEDGDTEEAAEESAGAPGGSLLAATAAAGFAVSDSVAAGAAGAFLFLRPRDAAAFGATGPAATATVDASAAAASEVTGLAAGFDCEEVRVEVDMRASRRALE